MTVLKSQEIDGDGGAGTRSETGIEVRHVSFDAPWDWLAAGWRDLWSTPGISLIYGAVFALVAAALTWGLTQVGWQSLVLVLSGGFLLVGPLLAVGLYEVSRQRENNQPVTLMDALMVRTKSPGQLAFLGFVLLFLFGAWLRIAFLLFAIFFGASALPPVEQFVPELLFTPHGLGMLIVGTAIGGLLALVTFTTSALAAPLLMDRKIDALSAMATSVRAVAMNPKAMLLWAGLIAIITIAGVATLFVGLAVAFPLVGHATWHAYRALVR